MSNHDQIDPATRPVTHLEAAKAAHNMRQRAAKVHNYSDAAYLDAAAALLRRVAVNGMTGYKGTAVQYLNSKEITQ